MSRRDIEITLKGIEFVAYYTPSNDMMEQTSINKGDFELSIIAPQDGDDGDITDLAVFKEWLNIGLEGKILFDYIVDDDYKGFIKKFGVHPLSLDVAFFRMQCTYYNNNDDQKFEIVSTKALNFTVKGRKYLEKAGVK